jgi:hypothetical protein
MKIHTHRDIKIGSQALEFAKLRYKITDLWPQRLFSPTQVNEAVKAELLAHADKLRKVHPIKPYASQNLAIQFEQAIANPASGIEFIEDWLAAVSRAGGRAQALDTSELYRLWPERHASEDKGKRVKEVAAALVRTVDEHRAPQCWQLFHQAFDSRDAAHSVELLDNFVSAVSASRRRPKAQTDSKGKQIHPIALGAVQASGSGVSGKVPVADKTVGAPHAVLNARQ